MPIAARLLLSIENDDAFRLCHDRRIPEDYCVTDIFTVIPAAREGIALVVRKDALCRTESEPALLKFINLLVGEAGAGKPCL